MNKTTNRRHSEGKINNFFNYESEVLFFVENSTSLPQTEEIPIFGIKIVKKLWKISRKSYHRNAEKLVQIW